MNSDNVPKLAIGILAVIAIFSIYMVGYDQGQLFSMVRGSEAFDTIRHNEFTHDLRHSVSHVTNNY